MYGKIVCGEEKRGQIEKEGEGGRECYAYLSVPMPELPILQQFVAVGPIAGLCVLGDVGAGYGVPMQEGAGEGTGGHPGRGALKLFEQAPAQYHGGDDEALRRVWKNY